MRNLVPVRGILDLSPPLTVSPLHFVRKKVPAELSSKALVASLGDKPFVSTHTRLTVPLHSVSTDQLHLTCRQRDIQFSLKRLKLCRMYNLNRVLLFYKFLNSDFPYLKCTLVL